MQWDSGYRQTYIVVQLSDMRTIQIGEAAFLSKDDFYNTNHNIPEGYVVVVFVNGRYEHVEIISPATEITKSLTYAPTLSDDERTVLAVTRSYKSTYAGISNYRYPEAHRQTAITLEDYNIAKEHLIEMKLLNKAGAITVDGKNAIGDYRLNGTV